MTEEEKIEKKKVCRMPTIEEDLEYIKRWTIETIKNNIDDGAIYDKVYKVYLHQNVAKKHIERCLKRGGTLEELYDSLKSKKCSLCVRPDYFPEPTPSEIVEYNYFLQYDPKITEKLNLWKQKQDNDGKKFCIKCWMEDKTWTDITNRRNASFCAKHQEVHRKRYLKYKKNQIPSSARSNKENYCLAKVCQDSSPDEIKYIILGLNQEQEHLQNKYHKIREKIKAGQEYSSEEKKDIEERIKQIRTMIKIASEIKDRRIHEKTVESAQNYKHGINVEPYKSLKK